MLLLLCSQALKLEHENHKAPADRLQNRVRERARSLNPARGAPVGLHHLIAGQSSHDGLQDTVNGSRALTVNAKVNLGAARGWNESVKATSPSAGRSKVSTVNQLSQLRASGLESGRHEELQSPSPTASGGIKEQKVHAKINLQRKSQHSPHRQHSPHSLHSSSQSPLPGGTREQQVTAKVAIPVSKRQDKLKRQIVVKANVQLGSGKAEKILVQKMLYEAFSTMRDKFYGRVLRMSPAGGAVRYQYYADGAGATAGYTQLAAQLAQKKQPGSPAPDSTMAASLQAQLKSSTVEGIKAQLTRNQPPAQHSDDAGDSGGLSADTIRSQLRSGTAEAIKAQLSRTQFAGKLSEGMGASETEPADAKRSPANSSSKSKLARLRQHSEEAVSRPGLKGMTGALDSAALRQAFLSKAKQKYRNNMGKNCDAAVSALQQL